jgi:allophanate hydrolase
MPALEVINSGSHTTIQDLGRTGFRDVGVPSSGPLDHISFRLANSLVGNPVNTPSLEILMLGPTLKVLADSVRIALVGGDASVEIGSGSGRRIPSGQSARLSSGDVLRIPPLGNTVCAYLAIEGGFHIPPVLGSASTYPRGRIGGIEGRRLQPRDLAPIKQNKARLRAESVMARPLDLGLDQPIRVILGPQADYFSKEAIETFLSADYVVSPQSDRMGYRLKGPTLIHTKGYNIISDGIVTGAIQVPGSGQPIILMVDNPTTGGYPKIATIISADIPVVGRRSPGRKVRFVAVEVEEAQMARRQQEMWIQREIDAIRPVE